MENTDNTDIVKLMDFLSNKRIFYAITAVIVAISFAAFTQPSTLVFYFNKLALGLLLIICSIAHFASRHDHVVPLFAVLVQFNVFISSEGACPRIFQAEIPFHLHCLVTLLVVYIVARKRAASQRVKTTQITLQSDIAVGGCTMLVLLISLTTLSLLRTQHNTIWEAAIFWIPQLNNKGILELITVSLLVSTLFVYYLEHKHPYQLSLLAFLVPQLIVATLEVDTGLEKRPDEALAIWILDCLSCGVILAGLMFDMVEMNAQSASIVKKMTLDKEGAQRRLSVQLQTQTDLTQKAYESGSAFREEQFEFMRRMSHRINNPIQEMLQSAQSLLKGTLDEPQTKSVTVIQHAADNLQLILDDVKYLLALESGNTSLEQSPFNLIDLIEEVLDMSSKTITQTDVELVYQIEDNVPLNLEGDPNVLKQILHQLVDNGVRFTDQGEVGIHILVSSFKDVEDRVVEIPPRSPTSPLFLSVDAASRSTAIAQPIVADDVPSVVHKVALEIHVFDTGVGLSAEDLDLCNNFQPFPVFSNNLAKTGSGLGLVTCYKLAQLLGGTLRAHARADGPGLVFVFTIVYDINFDAKPIWGQNISDLKALEGVHILIMDDNETARETTAKVLRQMACYVGTAAGGVQGMRELKMAEAAKEPYKVVLIDYHMPGMDGLETAHMLKEDTNFGYLHIVLLLSPIDAVSKKHITKIGYKYADAFVIKPVKRSSIARAVLFAMGIGGQDLLRGSTSETVFYPSQNPDMEDEDDSSSTSIANNISSDSVEDEVAAVVGPYSSDGLDNKEGGNSFSEHTKMSSSGGSDVGSSGSGRDSLRRSQRKMVRTPSRLWRVAEIPEGFERGGSGSGPDSGSLGRRGGKSKVPLRVLVADDDRDVQREVQALVEAMGHQCMSVGDGVAAVALVKKSSYDIIILDLQMPVLDGFRATEIIRDGQKVSSGTVQSATGRVPIIALTTAPSEEERTRCTSIGMDEYFDKNLLSTELRMYLVNAEQKRKLGGAFESVSLPLGEYFRQSSEPGAGRKLSGSTPTSDTRLTRRIEELENVISRFVPREFQDLIAPNGMESAVLGDAICRTITILFSDIRNFTSMTEKMHVHQVIEFLNTYLAFAIPAITEKGGFIDKFIGDAIMAIFPQSDPKEQAIYSVCAAVGVMKALDFMRESGFDAVETGIGINTGKTIVGIVGTETRMEPTALGDAVNLASRTESLCKNYGTRILITSFTRKAMGDAAEEMFTIRLIDTVTVRGKSQSCDLYEVIDGDRDDIRLQKKQLLPFYTTAVDLFNDGNYTAAMEQFKQCVSIYPADRPSLLFIERCEIQLGLMLPIPKTED